MLKLVVAFAVLFLGGTIPQALAVPLYSASAGGCGAQAVANSAAAVIVGTPQTDCNTPGQAGYGSAFAQSSSGGLGASADWTTYCDSSFCPGGSGAAGNAEVLTEFMITGPAGPVTISLNLQLTGTLGGGADTPGTSERRIDMTVIIAGVHTYRGWVDEMVTQQNGYVVTKGGSLVIPGTNCSSPCGISTPELLVMANTPYSLNMSLSAWVLGAFGGGGYAEALNTLYFPKDDPVFDLPDGYSAVIYGLNVEGNRVIGQPNGGGGEVPEPSTFGMVGAAAAAVLLRRLRKGR